MLAASRLILVSALAPSWSLFDQVRTNVRPTIDMLAASRLILVSALAPSWSFLGPRSHQYETNKSPINRCHARPFSVGMPSIFRCGMPPRPPIGLVHPHLDFQWGSRALGAESSAPSDPCPGVWISGSRGEAPASYILRQARAKRGFVRTGCLLALIPFSAQFAHGAKASCSISLQGGFQL